MNEPYEVWKGQGVGGAWYRAVVVSTGYVVVERAYRNALDKTSWHRVDHDDEGDILGVIAQELADLKTELLKASQSYCAPERKPFTENPAEYQKEEAPTPTSEDLKEVKP